MCFPVKHARLGGHFLFYLWFDLLQMGLIFVASYASQIKKNIWLHQFFKQKSALCWMCITVDIRGKVYSKHIFLKKLSSFSFFLQMSHSDSFYFLGAKTHRTSTISMNNMYLLWLSFLVLFNCDLYKHHRIWYSSLEKIFLSKAC